jgi:CDP-glycerol glycerophosphotransferase (TagB/SpsB family)
VYVSLADPHHRKGARDREVLQIEESELWHALKYADIVVNLYSTISLEACIFDKPAINMWYFGWPGRLAASSPVWKPYPGLIHNRRMTAYGAFAVARDRRSLMAEIRHALDDPRRFRAERAGAVAKECGSLDGLVCDRLAEECLGELGRKEALGAKARARRQPECPADIEARGHGECAS